MRILLFEILEKRRGDSCCQSPIFCDVVFSEVSLWDFCWGRRKRIKDEKKIPRGFEEFRREFFGCDDPSDGFGCHEGFERVGIEGAEVLRDGGVGGEGDEVEGCKGHGGVEGLMRRSAFDVVCSREEWSGWERLKVQ